MNKKVLISVGVGFISWPILLLPLGLFSNDTFIIALCLTVVVYVTILVIAAYALFIKTNAIVTGLVAGMFLGIGTIIIGIWLQLPIVNSLLTWACMTFGNSCP